MRLNSTLVFGGGSLKGFFGECLGWAPGVDR